MTQAPSLIELATRLAQGELTCAAAMRQALERIEAREPVLRAWAHLDAAQAVAAAAAADRNAATGPLYGVPVAVKDVFDTFDMPSAYGSPIYAGYRPAADAAVVAQTRAAGALVVGKTVTTEFATFTPNVTTNPWNAGHTPGGSSSGSAAAVADGMVPVAFGTQTIGSVIRPASFCGAVGYKPTFALLPRVGVKAISDCLDTVGCFTRSVADAAFFVARLSRRALDVPADMAAPRIGLCLTPQWPQAQPETVALFDTLASRLGGAGAVVREFALPQPFNDMNAAQDLVAAREMAECLADEHLRQPQLLGERLRRQLDHGRAIDAAAYDAAMALARVCRRGFNELLGDLDVLVVPSSPGEAPAGLGFTGDPVFNRTWSFLHTPCVHVPLTFGPRGLPLGLQVVGRIGDDARALACAHWVEERLRAPETRRLP